ncbi:uncharacterized protein LOC114357094 [Ostrinia furnacalis]|uniref:uncharacterized protein LOC114357094 n=1 Tax=Ostrinia furnacalis TaxID=93504 RepID=UPI00103C7E66|nr:uncharacterized protein LOC114357094 [Ostrinia furnacalis]
MKALTITLIATFSIFSINGRLIDKTEKNDETPPTEPTHPVRVSRQAFYEDPIGMSREENFQLKEEFKPYIRRGRYSMRSKSRDEKVTKAAKESREVTVTTKKLSTESEEVKPTKTLVKKPIPKFNEVDYEDFQGKMNKSPVKFADSGEHEDEDFNLDDYEFDVNHDEFVGRGKPLEPRLKLKEPKGNGEKKTPKTRPTSLSPPEIKMQSKVVIPSEPLKRTKNGISKKAAHKMKEDYYDDVITTTKAPEIETKRDTDDEFSDDTEESKEFNNKNPVRVVRSPWFVKFIASKMGDKTATGLTNVANALQPMWPPSDMTPDIISDLANDPMVDPLTGNHFMF